MTPSTTNPAPVRVLGSGACLPGDPLPVERVEEVLGPLLDAPPRVRRWAETTAPVLRELLDLRYVHYALDPVTREPTDDNVTLSVKAARAALDRAGLEPGDIDLLIYGSAQVDQMPTPSVRIQEALGIETCDELCVHANCTSAYKALYLAHQLLRAGRNRRALVVSSNLASAELAASYLNQPLLDRESLFLRWFLGDGAGAVVLGLEGDIPWHPGTFALEATYIESVGGRRPSLMFNRKPARPLPPHVVWEQGLHHLRQRFRDELASGLFQEEGGSVFKKGLVRMVEREGIPLDRVRFLQINLPARHIVASVMDECADLGIPRSALYTRLDTLGYCGPPMVFIGLDRILREERLESGDRILSFVTEVSKFMQAGYVIRHD